MIHFFIFRLILTIIKSYVTYFQILYSSNLIFNLLIKSLILESMYYIMLTSYLVLVLHGHRIIGLNTIRISLEILLHSLQVCSHQTFGLY